MKLFDDLIRSGLETVRTGDLREFPYNPQLAAAEGDPNELILRRDMAFELGEGSFPSVSLTTITQDPELVPGDGVYLLGPDLHEIRGDCPFARITILRTDDIYEYGDQAAYNLIKSLETQKFRIAPKGYMMRPSAMTNREQVRVSRKAIKGGLRFQNVGNLLIRQYHKNPHVQAVAVVFLTENPGPYEKLDTIADQIDKITKTLNHALLDVSMDCKACEWKPVCDQVEGMKAWHQKQVKQKEEKR